MRKSGAVDNSHKAGVKPARNRSPRGRLSVHLCQVPHRMGSELSTNTRKPVGIAGDNPLILYFYVR